MLKNLLRHLVCLALLVYSGNALVSAKNAVPRPRRGSSAVQVAKGIHLPFPFQHRGTVSPHPRRNTAHRHEGAERSNKASQKRQIEIEEEGKASILTSIFNLSNNVAGAGLLTLAAGKAVSGTGWVPSIMTCVALAFGSAQTFSLIGKACEMTGEGSFKGLWSVAFGDQTSWVLDSFVFVQTFFSSVIYTGLLGDIFSALLRTSKLPYMLTNRKSIILIAASCILWPLNMIRDMSALGFTSILGLSAVLYTVFFSVIRALDGTYALHPAGKFVTDGMILNLPSFAKSTFWNFDLNSLVLVSNLGLAFIAHYNAPSYWKSLSQRSSQRFTKVSFLAYTVLAIIYSVTMLAGYSTFGDVCEGNILLNYSAADYLSALGRLATGLSIIFGFPLVSNGCRESCKQVASALGIDLVSDPEKHGMLVTTLLVLTTSIALCVSDIKLVAGLSGALMGSSLVYICPTLIYTRIINQQKGKDSLEYRLAKRNLLFVPFGIFTATMGVLMTLKNTVLAKP